MSICPIGLIGWGTVGGGVLDVLERDGALIRERVGLDLRVTRIVTRNPARQRMGGARGAQVSADVAELISDPDIRAVIHVVGGTDVARDLCVACLAAGKPVVTANKAMIAEHGDALFSLAAQRGVVLAFEAAVGGGIPIVGALRDGLVANRIQRIDAILNGTCNFILTKMEEDGADFAEALTEAQRCGYAEEDPSTDIDGVDSAHKLAILARIAFSSPIPWRTVKLEGIREVTKMDIASAQRQRCRIRLVASVSQQEEGLELRVGPTLVHEDHPLASVRENNNGILIEGSNCGKQFMSGPGAGSLPTSSSVISDVVDVVTGKQNITFNKFTLFESGKKRKFSNGDEVVSRRFIKIRIVDAPGALSSVSACLSNNGISILSLHQSDKRTTGMAEIEIMTHPCRSYDIDMAGREISRLDMNCGSMRSFMVI